MVSCQMSNIKPLLNFTKYVLFTKCLFIIRNFKVTIKAEMRLNTKHSATNKLIRELRSLISIIRIYYLTFLVRNLNMCFLTHVISELTIIHLQK